MEFDYILTYRERGKKGELTLYSVRRARKLRRVLVKVVGKPARAGYREVARLAECGGLTLVKSEPKSREYSVRPDLVPVIGSFILLLRRSREPSRWCKAFNELMRGRAVAFGETFARFFDLAISASVDLKKATGKKVRGETVLPRVSDAVSASLKSFAHSIEKVIVKRE